MKIIQIDLNKDCSEVIQEAVAILEAGGGRGFKKKKREKKKFLRRWGQEK